MALSRFNPHRLKISDAWVVGILHGLLVLPFAITLRTVNVDRPHFDPKAIPNLTPHGYTWSLLIFIVPVAVLLIWLLPRPDSAVQRKAFWQAAGLLSLLGIGLDVGFGAKFLRFDNPSSNLGKTFRAYPFDAAINPHVAIPVEELVFYVAGFLTVLLLYIWGDEVWFGRYNQPDDGRVLKRKLEGLHWGGIWFSLAAIAAAWCMKGWIARKPGVPVDVWSLFPGYFAFLVVTAMTPTVLLFRVVREFINWRAFSLTSIYMLFVSMFWEATLALPFEWWDYQDPALIGLKSRGLFDLPVEAVLVWIAVSWTAVVVYEYWLVLGHRNPPVSAVVPGAPGETAMPSMRPPGKA